MKKTLSALTASLPLFYAAAIFILFLLDSTDGALLTVMFGYIAIALLLHIFFLSFAMKETPEFLSISNLILYSGNLILFVIEIIYWAIYYRQTQIATQNGAMGGGLGLVLLILLYLPHWASYFMTHIVGAICCFKALNRKCGDGILLCHILMQLLPVTDLASAVIVRHTLLKKEKIG